MKILGVYNETGPSYWRVYLPLMLMDGPDCHLTNVIREEELKKGYDVVYVSRYAPYNKLEQFLEWKNKYEFKLVVDIDDYWILDKHHILHDHWQASNVANHFIEFMKAADAITCTHERLREKILPYNKNVEIFPNAIPIGYEQFNVHKTDSNRVRLFWQGSNTHRRDIELLRNPLKRVHQELKDKVFMVFSGFKKSESFVRLNPDGSYRKIDNVTECEEMVSAYTFSFQLKGTVFNQTSVSEYYNLYQYCDIALVPLLDTTFNNYKSNLKVLEAAAVGAPVIVSKVNPYLNFPDDIICYVEKQTDWFKWIRLLTRSDRYRHELGEALHNYCNEHYNFHKINEARKEFICSSEILIF